MVLQHKNVVTNRFKDIDEYERYRTGIGRFKNVTKSAHPVNNGLCETVNY